MEDITKQAIRYGILVGFLHDAVMNGKYKDISGNQLCGILLQTLDSMDGKKEAEE